MNKNDTTKLEKAQQNLKLEFNNLELLKKAFIHRSYLNETKEENLSHNERLEFLGDAVLELLVTEHLFHKYPQRPEGDLTSFRSATVKTESLAETAMQIGLGEYIYMSKGEEATGGRT
ncbi:ribonuclease III, partial [Candidatus Dojkabacteria bacterium]|nr:ribonuclease III [Candidatus Dojkabacteria bacterium]